MKKQLTTHTRVYKTTLESARRVKKMQPKETMLRILDDAMADREKSVKKKAGRAP